MKNAKAPPFPLAGFCINRQNEFTTVGGLGELEIAPLAKE
jgi:hypothetical protein